jgi:small-conductance mechanosensitive channel/CRP-like cAMP-binding protein
MTFWQQILSATGEGPAFPWLVIGFIVIASVLLFAKPEERMRIRTALLLFALSLIVFLLAAALLSFGVPEKSLTFKWTRWAARIFQWLAIVNVAAVLLFELLLGPLRLKPPRIMRDLLLALAYVIVAITILSRDTDLTGIIATSAVLTAVIGLSFQDTLGNMMGGMALQMERAISVGDWIRLDNQEGLVKEIRWRHTAIETRNWDTIVIPNSVLMKSQVMVLGRRSGQPRQHRQWVYFNVDFRFSPSDVIDTVEAALRSEPIPNVATEPSPNCVLMDFKESYGSYAVRYWLTDLAVDDPTNSVVRTRIYFALRRAAIALSIPAHSIFVTQEDDSRSERKAAEDIQRRSEALKRVELFGPLRDDEVKALAPRLRPTPFTRGEVMTRQGAVAHWLYLMIKGEAEVRVSLDDGGLAERVAVLHAGDFFGERGMMTGEHRSATVIAITDVECYRVDKDAFHDILRERPELAEDISVVMAKRQVELEAKREDLNEEAQRARLHEHHTDLLRRIRGFFRLE